MIETVVRRPVIAALLAFAAARGNRRDLAMTLDVHALCAAWSPDLAAI